MTEPEPTPKPKPKHGTDAIFIWLLLFWPVAIYMILQNGKE